MAIYCKAYKLKDFRRSPAWVERVEKARNENGDGTPKSRLRELTDDSILYLHEGYIVTDGIFDDKNIIYDDVTPEWIEFCKKELQFQIPDYLQLDNGKQIKEAHVESKQQ